MMTPEVETFARRLAPGLGELVRAIAQLAQRVAPGGRVVATEAPSGLGFGGAAGDPPRLVVTAHGARLVLAFREPGRLSDPDGRLTPDGRLVVADRAALARPAVRMLLQAALAPARGASRPARGASRPARAAAPGKAGAAGDAPLTLADIASTKVAQATARSWAQWLAALDARGAKDLEHREIVALVKELAEVSPWWQQMIAVGYEQARGLRERHETPDGYQVSVSKTVDRPVADVYRAWELVEERRRWLGAIDLTVRKASVLRSLRITWPDGSHVSVMFLKKSAHKTLVQVDQRKLPSRAGVERARTFWQVHLGRLVDHFG